MLKSFNSNTANADEWLTPPYIISALGPFDLDPCSPVNRPWDTAATHYSKIDDGLSLPWKGRVWLNPPYGKETFKWMERLAKHGNGIALIFARTETKGFHTQIWNKAKAVFFFEGRLKFHYVDGRQGNTANAPSCLIAYDDDNAGAIVNAYKENKIKGRMVYLFNKMENEYA